VTSPVFAFVRGVSVIYCDVTVVAHVVLSCCYDLTLTAVCCDSTAFPTCHYYPPVNPALGFTTTCLMCAFRFHQCAEMLHKCFRVAEMSALCVFLVGLTSLAPLRVCCENKTVYDNASSRSLVGVTTSFATAYSNASFYTGDSGNRVKC
jgi:hypothetical protein